MRLLTHVLDSGEDRLAVVVEGDDVVDVEDVLGDGPWTMARLLQDVPTTLDRMRGSLERRAPRATRNLSSLGLLAPVRPGKIIAVGRNYREHAGEESAPVPEAPLLFAKFPSAVVGDGAIVSWSSALTRQVDYEAEMAVIIGRRARQLTSGEAFRHVLGFACLNDVSARDLQVDDGQWTRAKSLDTFCPMGPWVVTADEIPDPGALRIQCRVNGELRQDASTSSLVHSVSDLIAYCSQSFTLEPGDVIATGTPGGVGAFREPPLFLADGDSVEVEIERIGILRNRCRVLP